MPVYAFIYISIYLSMLYYINQTTYTPDFISVIFLLANNYIAS